MDTPITMFMDVDSPSPGFSTTTVSRTKEELGPGWAMDDVYPPLAELRRALLTDEEWAAMSSWEKDVWEMFYRPDWERLACIEEILEGTPAAQRAHRHEEILEALRKLEASSSRQGPAAAATSYNGHHDASHAGPDDTVSSAIVDKVRATTCSEPGQDTTVQIPRVTTVALLHEGVPELVAEPAALQCSPSTTDSGKEALDMDQSVPTGFINTAPMTCSTQCLLQLAIAVPVLDAPSSSTLIKYDFKTNSSPVAVVPPALTGVLSVVLSLQPYSEHEPALSSSSRRIPSTVLVHRPKPWPSFVGDHAAGDEARPLPWPSFREIGGCEFPKDAIERASQQCLSGSSDAEMSSVVEFQIPGLCGKHFTSADCTIIHDMCSAGELRHWNDFLLLIGYGSAYLPSVHSLHTALAWLSCSIPPACRMFRPRPLPSFECNQEDVPSISLTVQLWFSQTSRQKLCAHSHGNKYVASVPMLAQQYSLAGFPLTMGNIAEFQILDYSGNLCTSTGYILVHDRLIPGELRCLHEVLLFPQYWWPTSEWGCLNDVLWYFDCWRSTTCMQSAHTPISLLCTISGFQLLIIIRSIKLKLIFNGLEQSLILDSMGKVHMHVRVAYSVQLVLLSGSFTTVCFLNLGQVLVWPKQQHGDLLYSLLMYLAKFSGMFREYTCCATLVEPSFHCSVPDHSYSRWPMPWSERSGKSVSSCMPQSYAIQYECYGPWNFVTRGHMQVVRTKKQHNELICVSGLYIAKFSGAFSEFQNWLISKLQLTIPRMYLLFSACIEALVKDLCNILFSVHVGDELLSVAAISIWWFPPIQCKFLVASQLHLEHLRDSCLHVRARWNDLMTSPSRRAGISVQVTLRGDCHQWNRTNDQWLYSLCCAIPDADLSSMVICELWLLDHQDVKQTLTAWPSLQVQNASSESLVCTVAFGGGQGTFQGGRHMPVLSRHKELGFFDVVTIRHDMYFHLVVFYSNSGFYDDSSNIKDHRLQWDPGRFRVKSAWGQADFQGGRGVRNPSCTPRWAGTWAVVMGLNLFQSPVEREENYKYARPCNGYGIQKDHGDEPALSSPSPSSISHPLSL